MAGLGRRSHYRKHLTDSVLNDYPEPAPNECIAKVVGTRGGNQFEIVVAPKFLSDGSSAGDNQNTNKEWDKTPQLALLPTKFRKLVWVKRNDYVICASAQDDKDKDNDNDDGNTNNNNNNGDDAKDSLTKDNNEPVSPTDKESSSFSIEGGIRYMISHILYKDQVKHLKEEKMWPLDPYFSNGNAAGTVPSSDSNTIINDGKDQQDVKEVASTDGKEDGKDNATDVQSSTPRDTISDEDADDDDGDYEYDYGNGEEYEDDGIVYGNDALDDEYFVNTNRIAKMKIVESDSDEDSD